MTPGSTPFLYAGGLPYRPVRTARRPASSTVDIIVPAIPLTWDWPEFWAYVHRWMKQQGYARSTALLYRQVLRNFARVAGTPPAGVTRDLLEAYFSRLSRGHCSAHWAALNLSTLRTVFDKLFGLGLLDRRPGPRRPDALPDILNHDEALALLDACTTLRDRLLIGLLYGCGLTVGELRGLRWRDFDTEQQTVRAPGSRLLLPRTIPLPDFIAPLVQSAQDMGLADVYVFTGHRADRPLTSRWVQCLVRNTARRAGILKPVSPMTLRHSYAVHVLEADLSRRSNAKAEANIRELQTALGHRSVRTTLRYCRCLVPDNLRSPLDRSDPPLSDPPHGRSKGLLAKTFKPMAALVACTSAPSQFCNLLRCQLGVRLFANRKNATGPP